jgi:hypothetical protein
MNKYDVQMALERSADHREQWRKAIAQYREDMRKVMRRLIHEAAYHRMSVEEVARLSGLSKRDVRIIMRRDGLDPRTMSKALLSETAAKALAENAEIMGVDPREIDLASPLAYLPMGSALQQELREQSVVRVTDLSDTGADL